MNEFLYSEDEIASAYPRTMHLSQLWGFLRPVEAMFLLAVARTLPSDARIVNIGAGVGTSGMAFREAVGKDAQIWTIDCSQESPIGGLMNERNAFDGEGYGHLYPTQICGDSQNVGRYWENGDVDVVFVDGEHSSSAVRGDIEQWTPHLKPGGFIFFHDYNITMWWEVVNTVDEMLADWEIVATVDTLQVRKKPE